MAELIKMTKQMIAAGKASPASSGYKFDVFGDDLTTFTGNGPIAEQVRLAIIGSYKAQGLSEAQAIAKFNEQNPNF